MSISSSRWNPWIVALIRDHTIQQLSFNRLSSLRMASEKSEFERVVFTNRTYRKTNNVKQSVWGFFTPASVLSSVFSSSCLELRRSLFVHGLLLAMLFPPSRKKWSNHIHTVWYKVTWLGGILIPKFLNTMRVKGFKWEKIDGRKLAAPKTTNRRTKQKKTQKVKCLYFMGIYLARQLLGPIQGVQPQILWFIVRHYDISFRGPNCSF